jgi:sulfotransferase family protein
VCHTRRCSPARAFDLMDRTRPAHLTGLAAPPVFVVGRHRSGTTWVYDILTSHPSVAGVFESGMFAPDLGLGVLFAAGHWYDDEAQLEAHRRFFGASFRLNQLITREEFVEDLRELTGRWLARALEPEHRYLVEKTPEHGQAMLAIGELFPGAAFVHVIRDGRDAAVSSWAASSRWPTEQMRRPDAEEYARRWADTIMDIREQASRGGLRYLEVRYEDLRRDPSEWSRRMFDFCRIETDDSQLEEIVAATDLASLRMGEDDQFRRKGEIGGWRKEFGIWEGRRFHRGAGGMLAELGYIDDRLWWLKRRS